MTVTGSIGDDEPCALAGSDVAQTRKVMTRSRGTMERDDRRAVTNAELSPRQLTTIRKLKQSGIGHDTQCPVGPGCAISSFRTELTWLLPKASQNPGLERLTASLGKLAPTELNVTAIRTSKRSTRSWTARPDVGCPALGQTKLAKFVTGHSGPPAS